MRTEFKSGFVRELKEGTECEVVFELQVATVRGSDEFVTEVLTIVGCKLADGTILEKIDHQGIEWKHPDRLMLYRKL